MARSLAKRPAFTTVALVTVAVGVGSTSAVYSLANWLLLRPIPGVEEMDGLFAAEVRHRSRDTRMTGVAFRTFEEIARIAAPMTEIAGYQAVPVDFGVRGGDFHQVGGQAVTESFFRLLGVDAQVGRLFAAEEFEDAGAWDRVVISDALWRTRFGGSDSVIGTWVTLNGFEYEVIGVAERGFRGLTRIAQVDFWVVPRAYLQLRRYAEPDLADPGIRFLYQFVGRSPPGVDLDPLDRRMTEALGRAAEAHPDDAGVLTEYEVRSRRTVGLSDYAHAHTVEALRLFSAGAGLLLLLACANLANLMLVEAHRRRPETALRKALGASGGRIVRERMTEAVLLAVIGGVIGVSGANMALGSVGDVRLWDLPELGAPELQPTVILFAVSVSLLAALLFWATPAYLASRQDARPVMGASGSRSRTMMRTRALLTGAQVSISFVLLAGALLLTRSIGELRRVPLGFDPAGLSYHFVDPSTQGWDRADAAALASGLADDLSGAVGIRSVALTSRPPMTWGRMVTRFRAAEGDDAQPVTLSWIERDYFGAAGLDLLEGRAFLREEERVTPGSRAEAIIVNRALALELFGTTQAVGRTVSLLERGDDYPEREIVGVVEDERVAGVRGDPSPVVYAPRATSSFIRFTLVLRSDLPFADVDALVRARLRERAPGLALRESAPMSQVVADTLAEDRLVSGLVAAIAVLAVVLASVGLYGTIFTGVTERFREIGIRIALGAEAVAVTAGVFRRTFQIVSTSVIAGAIVATSVRGTIDARLFGVGVGAGAFLFPGLILVLVAVLATWLPARAALSVDPVEVLKSD